MCDKPNVEMGISWCYEKVYLSGSLDVYYRRLDPAHDHVWLKRDGTLLYWSSRSLDPGWEGMLKRVREFMREVPAGELFAAFERHLILDATAEQRAKLAEELCQELEFKLLP